MKVNKKIGYSYVKSVSFIGMDAIVVDVEVHIGAGLPCFIIVGLPDKSISESKERIRAAFKVLGLSFPAKRVTVNISPSNLPKEGTHYDFPIALGILISLGMVDEDLAKDWLVLGEISLDGRINNIRGILIASIYAMQQNYKLVCSLESAEQIYLSGNKRVLVFDNLIEVLSYKDGFSNYCLEDISFQKVNKEHFDIDISDVIGQEVAKRVFEIAAVFRGHILMIGPPGIGKSMLAKRMVTILPDLSSKEILEVSMVYSVTDKINVKYNYGIPYRCPHHTSTSVSLIGGGVKAGPGEISLAHNGVLFLDELAEFSNCLDGLRECMETREVFISRANHCFSYPANCQIIAAMNYCKCGYLNTARQCRKVPLCSKEYMKKISGPLLERFDFIVYMDNEECFFSKKSENVKNNSEMVKSRVLAARELYNEIYGVSIFALNIEEYFMDDLSRDFFTNFMKKKMISLRVRNKILKNALAISLLERSNIILKKHIAEACLLFRLIE